MIPTLKALAAVGEVRGGQLRLVCPLCGKRSLDLRLGEVALLASCFSAACKGRGYTILTRLGLPATSLSEAERSWARNEVFGRDADDLPPAAEVSVLDAVYRVWLKECPLSEVDKDSLLARGFSAEEIARYGYGSWEGRLDPMRLPRTDGVPGAHGDTVALDDAKYAGVLVPCRGPEGHIFALKVRLRVPDADGKMRTFSSASMGGPSGLYGVHHPLGSPRHAGKVWVVEGELKADLVFAKAAHPVIGIPGVHGV